MIDFDIAIPFPCFVLLQTAGGKAVVFSADDTHGVGLFTDFDLLERFRDEHAPGSKAAVLEDREELVSFLRLCQGRVMVGRPVSHVMVDPTEMERLKAGFYPIEPFCEYLEAAD